MEFSLIRLTFKTFPKYYHLQRVHRISNPFKFEDKFQSIIDTVDDYSSHFEKAGADDSLSAWGKPDHFFVKARYSERASFKTKAQSIFTDLKFTIANVSRKYSF